MLSAIRKRLSLAGRGPILQPALRVFAEASWITVIYAALAVVVSKHVPVLGPIEFVGFVLVGVLVARIGRDREEVGPFLLIVAVLIGAMVGWLASDEARSLLPTIPRALSVHLAGWFAGVAVIRGAVINTGQKAADDVDKLIRTVPVALAVIWAYMVFAARTDLWLPFAVSAMWGTVGFLSSSVISIGLARIELLHAGLTDKSQRRGWRWLVTAVGMGIVPIAIPVAVLSGIPLAQLLTPIYGPLSLLLSLLSYPLAAIVWLLTELVRPFAGPFADFLDDFLSSRGEERPQDPEATSMLGTILGLALWALTIFLVLLAIFMAARWLLRRKSLYGEDLEEAAADTERSIEVPDRAPREPPRPRFRRRGGPHDVVTAYLSALNELEGQFDVARMPSETPAQHVTRLRAAGVPAADDFARLAAGYQLARYGERPINRFENLRAVSRFQRLRRLLRASGA